MSASTELTTTENAIVEALGSGKTRRATAEELGISISVLLRRIRNNPTLADQVERAEAAAASMVLDDIRNIPNTDLDAQRARVAIEAWRTYLELRFPARYGKTVNMNVRTLDMNKALEQARTRARQALPITAAVNEEGDTLPAELV